MAGPPASGPQLTRPPRPLSSPGLLQRRLPRLPLPRRAPPPGTRGSAQSTFPPRDGHVPAEQAFVSVCLSASPRPTVSSYITSSHRHLPCVHVCVSVCAWGAAVHPSPRSERGDTGQAFLWLRPRPRAQGRLSKSVRRMRKRPQLQVQVLSSHLDTC